MPPSVVLKEQDIELDGVSPPCTVGVSGTCISLTVEECHCHATGEFHLGVPLGIVTLGSIKRKVLRNCYRHAPWVSLERVSR